MRVALLLVASAHAFVRPALNALPMTKRPALSPEMAGAIAKAKDAAGYEAIVQETMVRRIVRMKRPWNGTTSTCSTRTGTR